MLLSDLWWMLTRQTVLHRRISACFDGTAKDAAGRPLAPMACAEEILTCLGEVTQREPLLAQHDNFRRLTARAYRQRAEALLETLDIPRLLDEALHSPAREISEAEWQVLQLAGADLQRALEQAPNPGVRVRKALVHVVLGNTATAKQIVEEIVASGGRGLDPSELEFADALVVELRRQERERTAFR